MILTLHSTMVLLKHILLLLFRPFLSPLHSTMVLLKLLSDRKKVASLEDFTFHYGLIKTYVVGLY